MSSPCQLEFVLSWAKKFQEFKSQSWTPTDDSVELVTHLQRLRHHAWISRLQKSKGCEEAILTDVFLADPVTRVLAAASRCIYSIERREKVLPLIDESFLSHREVRCDAVEFLMRSIHRGHFWARTLNRLRTYLEAWTDWLLGSIAAAWKLPAVCMVPFGFSRQRISEVAYELHEESIHLTDQFEHWFRIQGIRRSMRGFGAFQTPFPEWDMQLRFAMNSLLHSKRLPSENCSLEIDARFNRLEALLSMR